MTTSSWYHTHTDNCKVPQSSSIFQTQGGFPMPRIFVDGLGKKEKQKLTMGEVIKITLWMVYQYTQREAYLTQLPEKEETTQIFHHETNGDFATVADLNSCDRRKLRNNNIVH
jgi:hypothetical protein